MCDIQLRQQQQKTAPKIKMWEIVENCSQMAQIYRNWHRGHLNIPNHWNELRSRWPTDSQRREGKGREIKKRKVVLFKLTLVLFYLISFYWFLYCFGNRKRFVYLHKKLPSGFRQLTNLCHQLLYWWMCHGLCVGTFAHFIHLIWCSGLFFLVLSIDWLIEVTGKLISINYFAYLFLQEIKWLRKSKRIFYW